MEGIAFLLLLVAAGFAFGVIKGVTAFLGVGMGGGGGGGMVKTIGEGARGTKIGVGRSYAQNQRKEMWMRYKGRILDVVLLFNFSSAFSS